MKKILKNLICLALCLTVIPISAHAATLYIGNGTTSVGPKTGTVAVELQDDDLSNYVKVTFQLEISGTDQVSIDFSPKTSGLSFGFDGTSNPVYTITAENGALFATTIGTITYKTTSNLNVGFKIVPTNVKFYKDETEYAVPGDAGVKIAEGTIKYEMPKSSEAYLTALTVNQGTLTPAFDTFTTEYTVIVKDTINSIKINASVCAGATQTGGGTKTNLILGENDYEIVVTAEDGTTQKIYKVKVIRGEVQEPSAYIKSLVIDNVGVALSPEFDPMNNIYTAKVGEDIDALNIDVETEDPLAVVTIEGNEDFVEGKNVVTIKVVSSDGSDEQTYTITVTKELEEEKEETLIPVEEEKNDKKKTWILVLIGAVIVLIVGGVAFILFRKKRDPKDKKGKMSGNSNAVVKDQDDDYLSINSKEETSVTDILKAELFDDDRTQTFDEKNYRESIDDNYSESLDKTKEFNFKDFE